MGVESRNESEKRDPAGSIVRVINGVPYTVLIHFNSDSKEQAKDKAFRLIKNAVQRSVESDHL